MDAGRWPTRGYGTPWIYRSISGEYACLEKRFEANLGRVRPGPNVWQDPQWSDATPPPQPPSSCAPRALRQPGKENGGNRAAPCERKPRGGSAEADLARATATNSRGAVASTPGRLLREGGARGPLPAAPPSYETHMLRRLRAGQGSHKPHEPRPPPYVSPPAYDAPHRTLPAKRPRAAPQPPAAKRGRPAPPGKGGTAPQDNAGRRRSPESAPCPAPRRPRLAKEVLGGWSYHAESGSLGRRAGTGAGARCPARGGSADPLLCRASSPDGGSHTLPRAAGRAGRNRPAAGPSASGRQRLPSGWGFGYASSPRSGLRRPPTAPTSGARGRSEAGGVFVIDATGAVIRAEFIPAPPSRPPSASRPAGSADQPEPLGAVGPPASTRPVGQRAGAAAQGSPEPLARGPKPASPQARELPGHPPALAGWKAAGDGDSWARPCAQRPQLRCARDLREAVSRIRRHTAPDSESDSEPEEPAPRGHMAWRARQRREALSYSSSSLESSGSGGTIVRGRGRDSGVTAIQSPDRPCSHHQGGAGLGAGPA